MGMVKPFTLLLLMVCSSPAVKAKDFGVHGTLYPIAEEDPIALIQQKLKTMEETGELAQHTHELQKYVKSAVERPAPVSGITKATKSRVFYYDPSYVVSQHLRDHAGKVFAKKGEKINPLTKIALKQSLLFFDGDDKEQLAWAHAHLQEHPLKTKLILIRGAPLSMSEELKVSVYLDQGGILTQKLGVTHVPAHISQEGYFLRVEEIPLSRKDK